VTARELIAALEAFPDKLDQPVYIIDNDWGAQTPHTVLSVLLNVDNPCEYKVPTDGLVLEWDMAL
jgi:hypothetical protein